MTSKIKQWLSWIVNEVFLDSYKHLSKMFDFIRNSKIDGEIRDLVDEYKLKYKILNYISKLNR